MLARDKQVYTLEIDIVMDIRGEMIAVHDWNQTRVSRGRGLWSELDFHTLPSSDKEYVIRKIVDGRFSNVTKSMKTYIPTARQYIKDFILPNSGMSLLIDARNAESAIAIAQLSHYREMQTPIDNIWIQVYNFDFKNAWEFIAMVEAQNPARTWRNIPIVTCVHQRAMHKLAGIDNLDLDHNSLIAATLEFLNSFEAAGLRLIGHTIPVKGGAKYYDPKQRIVVHKELNKTFSAPEIVAWYAKDYALQVVLEHKKLTVPHLPILAPSSKYLSMVNNVIYAPDLVTGELRTLVPSNPVHWLLFNGGLAQTVFECGADWALSDDIDSGLRYLVNGTKQIAPDDYNHEPSNQAHYIFD
jgi:hypothetical protein